MKKTDRLGLIRQGYSLTPVSFMKIGQELLSDSPTAQSVIKAHDNLKTGLKVVGVGLFGLFVVHKFIK